ncbi:hypothetical protein UF64_12105 [Thalassospira sp. HJ]|nr:hypothetical protein UF64_12105 [Thalassospira sp. HJ]
MNGRAYICEIQGKSRWAGRHPAQGIYAGVRKYKLCPSDRSDLHGLLCRKTLKDIHLPAVSLRASAQI